MKQFELSERELEFLTRAIRFSLYDLNSECAWEENQAEYDVNFIGQLRIQIRDYKQLLEKLEGK